MVCREADYLKKVYGTAFAIPDHAHYAHLKTAMAPSSGVVGGYAVPTQFVKEIMPIVAELGFVRKRAQIVHMTSSTLAYPLLDVVTAQAAGTSPFSGGLLMNWLADSATRTETDPQFKQLELKAWELSGVTTISQPLYEDGVNFANYLTVLIANACRNTRSRPSSSATAKPNPRASSPPPQPSP